MLKRNGELCRHKVPDFPGLLTDSEHKAYLEVIEYMKEELEFSNNCERIFHEFEKQIPRLKNLAGNGAPPDMPSVALRDGKDTWQILDVFYRKEGVGELLFCSRQTKDGQEFSVLKKFYPESGQIIEVFGKKINVHYLANGKEPSRVLECFLDNELYHIEIYRKELELRIAKDLFKRHSANICRRVCKAVAPLYGNQRAIENENVSARKITIGTKMKL